MMQRDNIYYEYPIPKHQIEVQTEFMMKSQQS